MFADTFATASCDSIRNLNLIVLPLDTTSESNIICDGDSYLGYTATGVYVDTFTNANGCDSIHTLDLVVEVVTADLGPDTYICVGDTLTLDAGNPGDNYAWGGPVTSTDQTIDVVVPGTYSLTVISAGLSSCIATDAIDVELDSLPESSFSLTQTGATIDLTDASTNADSIVYLYGDGNFGTATNYTYTANGTYTVCQEVTNRCGTDSTCTVIDVVGVGIAGLPGKVAFNMYPNPTTGAVTVDLGAILTGELTVTNVVGQHIALINFEQKDKLVLDLDTDAGVYFVMVQTLHGTTIGKLVIEE